MTGMAGPAYRQDKDLARTGRRAAVGEAFEAVAGQRALSFAGLLRQLRAEARLTQEELAEAAGLSPRSVSDLERGLHATAHKDTALLLAGALSLGEPARDLFVAAARGQSPCRRGAGGEAGGGAGSVRGGGHPRLAAGYREFHRPPCRARTAARGH